MRFGLFIMGTESGTYQDILEQVQIAEELGFDHAWTYDHLAWRDLRDSTWFAAVPTLAAAAMLTSRIRLGTLVASPNFRHPVPFARELLTLDDLAEGRLTVGIGAGGQGWDTTVLGQEPWSMAERLERFAEFVDLLDRLLTDRAVSFEGRFWSAREARTHPGCVQEPRVPFAIAATGPRSMRVAARHASIWVTNGDRAYEGWPLPADQGAAVVARQLRAFEHVCEAEDRDPATVGKLVLTGPRAPLAWQGADRGLLDFFDLKGVVEALVSGLHLAGASYTPPEPEGQHPSYMPGRVARLLLDGQHAGWLDGSRVARALRGLRGKQGLEQEPRREAGRQHPARAQGRRRRSRRRAARRQGSYHGPARQVDADQPREKTRRLHPRRRRACNRDDDGHATAGAGCDSGAVSSVSKRLFTWVSICVGS